MRQECRPLALCRSKPFLICDGIKDLVKYDAHLYSAPAHYALANIACILQYVGEADLRCVVSSYYSCIYRLRAGVGVRDRDLPVLQRRRGREARDLQDLLFVEGLPLQQGPG